MTEHDLQDALWRVTMKVLGLDPDSLCQDIQKRVRLSYSYTDDGNPDWRKDEETTFIRLSPAPDSYTDLMDIGYESTANGLSEQVSYHRCFEITWINYGPNAGEVADIIRVGMLRDNIRQELAENDIAIIRGLKETIYMPEQDSAGQWWNRYDTKYLCYVLYRREYAEEFIDKLSTVSIDTKQDGR